MPDSDWLLRLARLQSMTDMAQIEHEDWIELLSLVADLGRDYVALKAEIITALREGAVLPRA